MCHRLWKKKIWYPCAHTSHLYIYTSQLIARLSLLSFHFISHPTISQVSVKTMTFALQNNGGVSIGLSSLAHCVAIYDQDFPAEDSDSSSDSSIGRNSVSSEDSSDHEDATEVEVQSSLKGPLDTMNDLEEDLPVK